MSYTSPSVTPSGTTFAQFQSGGESGHLERLIAAQLATANPTAAITATATGGGQTVAAPTLAATALATGGGTTIANPSAQATVLVGLATTGSLPAGTYYVGYTWATASGGQTTLGAGTQAPVYRTLSRSPQARLRQSRFRHAGLCLKRQHLPVEYQRLQ